MANGAPTNNAAPQASGQVMCPECGKQIRADPGGNLATGINKQAYSCSSCGYRGSFEQMVEDKQDNPVGSH